MIHNEVMGPMETKSQSRARFVVTFLDEYKRYVVAYYIAHKSKVVDKFIEFKMIIERTNCRLMLKIFAPTMVANILTSVLNKCVDRLELYIKRQFRIRCSKINGRADELNAEGASTTIAKSHSG